MHTFVKVFLELFFIDLFRVFIKYIPYLSTSRGIVTLCNLHFILTFNFFNLIFCDMVYILMNINMILFNFISYYLICSEFIRIHWKYAHCSMAAHCRTAGQLHTAACTARQLHTAAHTAALLDTAVRSAVHCRTLRKFECRTAAHRTPRIAHCAAHTVIKMMYIHIHPNEIVIIHMNSHKLT
jgi:hypothetical protein